MDYEIECEKKLKKENNKIKIKYYFWEWCNSYGWRQFGKTDGYDSIKKLKWDCAYYINESKNWKILKAEVIESKF